MKIKEGIKSLVYTPKVFQGLLLVNLLLLQDEPPVGQAFLTFVRRWGLFFISLGLTILFAYGFWHVAGTAREIIKSAKELKKGQGKVTKEQVMEHAGADFWIIGLQLGAMAIPTAAYLNWDTIQNLFTRVVGIAEEI